MDEDNCWRFILLLIFAAICPRCGADCAWPQDGSVSASRVLLPTDSNHTEWASIGVALPVSSPPAAVVRLVCSNGYYRQIVCGSSIWSDDILMDTDCGNETVLSGDNFVPVVGFWPLTSLSQLADVSISNNSLVSKGILQFHDTDGPYPGARGNVSVLTGSGVNISTDVLDLSAPTWTIGFYVRLFNDSGRGPLVWIPFTANGSSYFSIRADARTSPPTFEFHLPNWSSDNFTMESCDITTNWVHLMVTYTTSKGGVLFVRCNFFSTQNVTGISPAEGAFSGKAKINIGQDQQTTVKAAIASLLFVKGDRLFRPVPYVTVMAAAEGTALTPNMETIPLTESSVAIYDRSKSVNFANYKAKLIYRGATNPSEAVFFTLPETAQQGSTWNIQDTYPANKDWRFEFQIRGDASNQACYAIFLAANYSKSAIDKNGAFPLNVNTSEFTGIAIFLDFKLMNTSIVVSASPAKSSQYKNLEVMKSLGLNGESAIPDNWNPSKRLIALEKIGSGLTLKLEASSAGIPITNIADLAQLSTNGAKFTLGIGVTTGSNFTAESATGLFYYNYYELNYIPTTTTTTPISSTTTAKPPTTATFSTTPTPSTSTTSTSQSTTTSSKPMVQNKANCNIKMDYNISLPGGTIIQSKGPWPPELDDQSSPTFKNLANYMVPPLKELYTGYDDVDVTITGFRRGSIIADYIVALRSLTQLTEAEIQQQVEKQMQKLQGEGTSPVTGFPWGPAKPTVNVTSVVLANGNDSLNITYGHSVIICVMYFVVNLFFF